MVTLSPSATLVLREHKEKQEAIQAMLGKPLKDDDMIFSNIYGKPLLPNTVTHAWIKMVRRAGLAGIRLHDARHIATSH
jgi:integrase